MKKFFSMAVAIAVFALVFSSCKKDDDKVITDDQLIENISKNVNYTGSFNEDGEKNVDVPTIQFMKSGANLYANVTFESGILNGEGTWSVKNKELTLTWTSYIMETPVQMTFKGSISGNGDKFTLADVNDKTTTMNLKKK